MTSPASTMDPDAARRSYEYLDESALERVNLLDHTPEENRQQAPERLIASAADKYMRNALTHPVSNRPRSADDEPEKPFRSPHVGGNWKIGVQGKQLRVSRKL